MTDLNREKLLEHLQTNWSKKWEERLDRPDEIIKLIDTAISRDHLRTQVRELYFQAYMDGVIDIFNVVLEFDDDLRGVESLMALTKDLQKARA